MPTTGLARTCSPLSELRCRARRLRPQCLLPLLVLLPGVAVNADCAVLRSGTPVQGDVVTFAPQGRVPRGAIRRALGQWRACPNYGSDFPLLVIDEESATAVAIRFVARSSGQPYCGRFGGRTITLFAAARTRHGATVTCGAVGKNLAHEIGHVLGLVDLERRQGCASHIMGPIRLDAMNLRWVTREECSAVGRRWRTPHEGELVVASQPSPGWPTP